MMQVDKSKSPDEVGTLRNRELSLHQIEVIRRQPSANLKKIKSTQYGLNDSYNPLFELKYLDLHRFEHYFCNMVFIEYVCRSIPVECLHTILLGPLKYLLTILMDRLSPDDKCTIEAKINSFSFSGFDERISGRSICRYS